MPSCGADGDARRGKVQQRVMEPLLRLGLESDNGKECVRCKGRVVGGRLEREAKG